MHTQTQAQRQTWFLSWVIHTGRSLRKLPVLSNQHFKQWEKCSLENSRTVPACLQISEHNGFLNWPVWFWVFVSCPPVWLHSLLSKVFYTTKFFKQPPPSGLQIAWGKRCMCTWSSAGASSTLGCFWVCICPKTFKPACCDTRCYRLMESWSWQKWGICQYLYVWSLQVVSWERRMHKNMDHAQLWQDEASWHSKLWISYISVVFI